MDITLLLLGSFLAISIYFNKKLGIIIGLLLLVFMVDYPVKVQKAGAAIEDKCSKQCKKDVNDELVCKSECIKNLKDILK